MIPLPYTPSDLTEFRQSQPLTEHWKELMADPTTKRLLKAIKQAASPTVVPLPQAGVHPDTTTAHWWHFCMGMNAVLEQLERCTLSPGETHPDDRPIEEEFVSNLPAEYQKDPTKP